VFRAIPLDVLGPDQVFVEYWRGGAEVWDNAKGELVWRKASEPLLEKNYGESRRRKRRSHRELRAPGAGSA
jgi:hypothetical protein